MSAQAPPAAAAVAAQQQPRGQRPTQDGLFEKIWPLAQGLAIFLAMQAAMKYFMPGPAASTNGGTKAWQIPSFESRHVEMSLPEGLEYAHPMIPERAAPLWPDGTAFDLNVYLMESVIITKPLSKLGPPIMSETNLKMGNSSEYRFASVDVPFSPSVQGNGTLWAHIFVNVVGSTSDPSSPKYDSSKAFHVVKLLTRYQPKRKVVKTKKLLGGKKPTTPEEVAAAEAERLLAEEEAKKPKQYWSYWHSNLTLNLVTEPGEIQLHTVVPVVRQHIALESTGARDATGRNGWYYPVIVYPNDFWLLKEHMLEINSTVSSLPLYIEIKPIKWWQLMTYASLDESFKQQAEKGTSPMEFDEFKRVLIETNIYLLGTTFFVSILHSIFEILAFKSDISHWRNKKNNVGISVRTILANVVMQGIILLYLLDNNENTSWMILFSQGMGIFLELWKVTKTVNVKIAHNQRDGGWLGTGSRIIFEDKHQLSETEQKTKEYDEIAFYYLYRLAIPLLLAYAVYSVMYDSHKSWYSFVITTLVGSVYAYGFLMMVPSLYINYRLQSVAHMPSKAMFYKFLNTFIDDLFAFTIKMPTLHRLATLRDDVIFFIYLYQSYIYKVDHKRVNEFGQGGDDDEPQPAVTAGEEPVPGTSIQASAAKKEAVEGMKQRKSKK